MPIRRVRGGYQWGSKGKVYRNRKGAERQAAAAYASGYKKSEDWWDTIKAKKKKNEGYKAPPGVYTKPRLRERIHAILLNQSTHGTAAGKWSARKSQELNRRYKEAGGGFVN